MPAHRAAFASFVALAAVGVVGYRSFAVPSLSDAPVTVGIRDGVVPDGTGVFSDLPAVTRLDPALLHTLRRAARDRPTLVVNSGWRSRAYQQQLLEQAVAEYGSRTKAARWVAAPDKSAHVSGDAVDIGPPAAAAWLSRHGARYGLCRVYVSEPWHFELRPSAVNHGCPSLFADPTHDPRMRSD